MIISENFTTLCRDSSIRFFWHGSGLLPVGTYIDSTDGFEIEPHCVINGGCIPRKMGAFSYSNSRIPLGARIGRYCSIGENVRLMGTKHPSHFLSSSPIFYNDLFPIRREYFDRSPTGEAFGICKWDEMPKPFTCGNDVWIGDDVLISHGVHIGTGAIIAARSVVTKNVPPYAIVAGSPACVKKYRFSERVIEALLSSQWWEWSPDLLSNIINNITENFEDQFSELTKGGTVEKILLPVVREHSV